MEKCSLNENDNVVYLGTELKFAITITAGGFNMEEDDFNVVFKNTTNGNKVELAKEDLVNDGELYYALVNTAALGIGYVNVVTTAYVPDADFDDGLRTEVNVIYELVNIKRA